MLRATGDGVLSGSRWDELLSVSIGAHSDLGHTDRLLWIDAMCALDEMSEDDADTAGQLLARLEAAAAGVAGDRQMASNRGWRVPKFTSWQRFAGGVAQRHDSLCHQRRYELGRERFYHAIRGEPGEPVVCGCADEGRIRGEILKKGGGA